MDELKDTCSKLESTIEEARKLLEKCREETGREMMYKINLNDCVRVKLTDEGKRIYRKFYEDVNKYLTGRLNEPAVDEKGFTTMQIREFANIYGKYLFCGSMWNVIEENSMYLHPSIVGKVVV